MQVNSRKVDKKHYFYRKTIIFYLIGVVLGLSWLSAGVKKAREPLPTRWMSPDGLPKPRHLVPIFAGPLLMVPVDAILPKSQNTNLPFPGSKKRICVVVEDSLYPQIQTKLARFIQDLRNEGYGVLTYRFVSGMPEDLRAFLRNSYTESSSLFGAILIGDIPYIIYEMMEDWDGEGGNPPEYEDFPCDLFYMDLDGTWSDVKEEGEVHAGNGKYDTRSGDIDLEIWVSRMQTNNLTSLGRETAILNNYFYKNYNYRHGKLRTLSSALVYDDDDWSKMGPEDKSYLRKMLSSVTLVNNPEATTAKDYKTKRMPTNQEFIFTRSHGYPGGHGYYQEKKTFFDWVYADDYWTVQPPALFYSFYVCSGCDYTSSNFLGGITAFNDKSGLLVWGSTKTGGIWADKSFYSSLSEGSSFGAAFLTWFNYVQSTYPDLAPPWWYGMVFIGDGSLHPAVSISGYVKDSSGVGIKGVTLNFSNNGGTTTTDNKGSYSQSILTGWSGKVTPRKTGYTFNPAYRNYVKLSSNKTSQNYKAVKK